MPWGGRYKGLTKGEREGIEDEEIRSSLLILDLKEATLYDSGQEEGKRSVWRDCSFTHKSSQNSCSNA